MLLLLHLYFLYRIIVKIDSLLNDGWDLQCILMASNYNFACTGTAWWFGYSLETDSRTLDSWIMIGHMPLDLFNNHKTCWIMTDQWSQSTVSCRQSSMVVCVTTLAWWDLCCFHMFLINVIFSFVEGIVHWNTTATTNVVDGGTNQRRNCISRRMYSICWKAIRCCTQSVLCVVYCGTTDKQLQSYFISLSFELCHICLISLLLITACDKDVTGNT